MHLFITAKRLTTFLAAAVVAVAVLPTAVAHAGLDPIRLNSLWTYTSSTTATWKLEVPHGSAGGTLTDKGLTRAISGSVTDAVSGDGKCVSLGIHGLTSQGQITETACNGTISFTVATSNEDLEFTVFDAAASSVGSQLWSSLVINHFKPGSPAVQAGTGASWAYTGPRNFIYSFNAPGFKVTGSGFDSADGYSRFFFTTVTRLPAASSCIGVKMISPEPLICGMAPVHLVKQIGTTGVNVLPYLPIFVGDDNVTMFNSINYLDYQD